MRLRPDFGARWRNIPLIVTAFVLLLVAAGIGVILQNEHVYRTQKVRETQVEADILAASATAALDFGDAGTAQEAVDALRVNPQIVAAALYDEAGRRFAAYQRVAGAAPPLIGQIHSASAPIQVTAPVVQGGKTIGTVYLGALREPVARRVTRYAVIALLVLLASIVVAVLGVAATALRRVNRALEDRAAALSDAYSRLRIESEERAKAEEQLRQAQKMQALGQLTGGIAHDFNNMLTVIQGSADILRRQELSDDRRIRFADAIVETASRAAALTGQLLAFARRQPLKPEVIDINHRIGAMSELLDRTLGETIDVRTVLRRDVCAVEVDPAQLESAVLNIAVNARDAMPDGGVLTIATDLGALEDGQQGIALSVSDTGTGIDQDTLNRVFEPFFTTKTVGKGTGLGLSQVYGFATQSGGSVKIDSEIGKGTTITLTLPCTDRQVAAEAEESVDLGEHRTGLILVVDDNEEVGAFAESLLVELGHTVIRARSAAEALTILDKELPDLLFTDVVMPGMSGLELADAVRARHPRLPIVLTTGYSDEVSTSGTRGLPVVFKPYRLELLAKVLDEALEPVSNG